ncbi:MULTISPECIES: exodeoxyribonuclease VII small subunit [unclassified Leptolyngbya]|uniref:exodeoxyribonuclease VII small subunit n=1 Tax=unclassified Leptolyngbya TaxID=2650499 RepID=UPI001682E91C|nr:MULTISPECIES: exodeoxyribonuclease VII small subunit [unclassified Leptolyngbya]MBD1911048.1 exodeoxyribonuclease VII small subunit [Leptolyngbya sp. FACHB-8]MBD2158286.1 exodeoxyribonuclease VII small subunit [Leptolyngbya sp. FACHB-16]
MARRSKSSETATDLNWRYEASISEVERIIQAIEGGDLDLAEVFEQFATAVQHLNQCETFLGQQQQQMAVLIETLQDGAEDF